MKTYPALYIDERGVVRYNLFPEEPKAQGLSIPAHLVEYKYQLLLTAAKESAIEVRGYEYQGLPFDAYDRLKGMEIIPLPSGWSVEVKEEVTPLYSCGDIERGVVPMGAPLSHIKQVAVLIPPKQAETLQDRINAFIKRQEDLSPEIQDIVSRRFWEMLEDIDVTQKESQEELWDAAADIVEDNIGRYYHDLPTGQLTLNIVEDLKKQFTITRNSDNK